MSHSAQIAMLAAENARLKKRVRVLEDEVARLTRLSDAAQQLQAVAYEAWQAEIANRGRLECQLAHAELIATTAQEHIAFGG